MSGTVVLSGDPRPGSRTTGLAMAVGAAAAQVRGEVPPEIVELAGFGPRLLTRPGAEVDRAVAVVREADLLVAAAPAYPGAFRGLAKDFLYRLPAAGLAGRQALTVASARSPGRAEAVDGYLRALLRERGAGTPGPGLAVTEGWLAEATLDDLDATIAAYLDRVRDALHARQPVAARRLPGR